jgi:hypothetical protein
MIGIQNLEKPAKGMETLLKMSKIDIKTLERAYAQRGE